MSRLRLSPPLVFGVFALLCFTVPTVASSNPIPTTIPTTFLNAQFDAPNHKIIGSIRIEFPDGFAGIDYEKLTAGTFELTAPRWSDLFGLQRDRLSRVTPGLRKQDVWNDEKAETPRVVVKSQSHTKNTIEATFETNLEPFNDQRPEGSPRIWILSAWHPTLKVKGSQISSNYIFKWKNPGVSTGVAGAKAKIVLPSGEILPEEGGEFRVNQVHELSAVLARGAQIETTSDDSGAVTTVYRNKEFSQLGPVGLKMWGQMTRFLGKNSSSGVVIAEVDRAHSLGAEGIIPLQFPTQALIRRVIAIWSTWYQWQLAEAMPQQWFGATVRFADKFQQLAPDAIGLYFADILLSENSAQFYNINRKTSLLSWIHWTYEQHFFAMAKIGRRSWDSESLESTSVPDRLIPIRLAIAMRQYSRTVGQAHFLDAFRSSFQKYRALSGFTDNEGVDFDAWLQSLISVTKDQAAASAASSGDVGKIFSDWLTTAGWWDPALDRCEESSDGTLVVVLSQNGRIALPARVELRLPDGKTISEYGSDRVVFPLIKYAPGLCSKITVDANRESFDENRFNNRQGIPGVGLFPVTVDTVKDDAYTIAWVPMLLRRSGQPWTYGLVFGLLRDIEAGAFLWAGYAPSLKSHQMVGRYQTLANAKGYSLRIHYQREFAGDQKAAIEPIREFSGEWGDVELRARLEATACAANADSTCATQYPVGASMEWSSSDKKGSAMNSIVNMDVLAGVPLAGRQQAFLRSFVRADANWAALRSLDFFSRFFWGKTQGDQNLPDSIFFDPQNIYEAGMRVDEFNRRSLLSEQITAGTIELRPGIPYLRGDSDALFVVTSKARLALFADAAVARRVEDGSRLLLVDYGTGLRIPLGGDIGGAGTAVFGGIALDVVLGSRVNDNLREKPSFLFSVYRVQ